MRGTSWLSRVGLLALSSSLLPAPFAGATAPIEVALRASFTAPPLLLELLETATEESEFAYTPLLDRIADGYFDEYTTDRSIYDAFLELLQNDGILPNQEALDSFQFAFSIHSAAPRIEAHLQYYNTSVRPARSVEGEGCSSWLDIAGRAICAVDIQANTLEASTSVVVELPFDRTIDHSNSPPSAVLYADITSKAFRGLYKKLRGQNGAFSVRYASPTEVSGQELGIQSYGVELALKRTDYIVIDDRDKKVDDSAAEERSTDSQNALVDVEVDEIKPLSNTELKSLGMKAASLVMKSPDPLEGLLKLTQDFPKYSSSIAEQEVSEDFLNEHRANREIVPAGYNVLWMNGMQMDSRKLDAFSLLEHLRRERRLIDSIKSLGLNSTEAINVLAHPAVADAQADEDPQRYDYRDEIEGGNVIIWLNNIEKDERYDGLPSSVTALLQRTYPGQLPGVRREFHKGVFPADLSNLNDLRMVVESLQSLVQRRIPVEFGIVPTVSSEESKLRARVTHHLVETYGLHVAMTYLENLLEATSVKDAGLKAFIEVTEDAELKNDQEKLNFEEILQSDALTAILEETEHYISRLRLSGTPAPGLVNGVSCVRDEDWLSTMSTRVSSDLRKVQRGVFDHKYDDDSWLPDIFLSEASAHRNPLVVPEDEKSIKIIDMLDIGARMAETRLPRISSTAPTLTNASAEVVIAGDFDSERGKTLLLEAAKFFKEQPGMDVVFLYTGDGTKMMNVPRILGSHGQDQEALSWDMLKAAIRIDDSEGPPVEANTFLAREFWATTSGLLKRFGLQPSVGAIIFNGRLVGPIGDGDSFTKEDFEGLLKYEQRKRMGPAFKAIESLGILSKTRDVQSFSKLSVTIARSAQSDVPEGIFESLPTVRTNVYSDWNSTHTAIHVGSVNSASIEFIATLDPATEAAQKWVPILKTLSELSGVSVKIFLNPREAIDELPVKRFYRYILNAKPQFNDEGQLQEPRARFLRIPADTLLTMGLDVPAPWHVAPKLSVHDLDNIKLEKGNVDEPVEAIYALEHILVEGHSREVSNGAPPRGAQLILATESGVQVADTIIMANLGYFQFKANPGRYSIGLKKGRSAEIFKIDSVGAMGYSSHPGDETTEVTLMSFAGLTLFPRLSRQPDMDTEDVLEQASSAVEETLSNLSGAADQVLEKVGIKNANTGKFVSQGMGMISSLARKTGIKTDLSHAATHADINIFSVASGHLYERMLNIMMVSVMRHTEHTVKFWFIEQFLSPSFKSFLPTMAAQYGFRYEMVTYKWPHWLRAQKEKQREIWGYKILFLDVLFPLDLDKVIFVDADQIVRTDMHDLVAHDLHGAPYGFTPMCDSRTEMEGFRFWKQGYWKNFLRGRPYHISALYVVDLQRFRQLAAGDRMRQQYQQLSADPNSLSNLDQDLPNNMQIGLPIHSLPQEWLWCETWCSDESLATAKTIDLCNNPLTKEPKLDRARRQVPEWTEYDEEIAALARRMGEGVVAEGKESAAGASTSKGASTKDEL
ncbi:hypothetical protein P152DRAFT_408965 [Eremomyces bilateralis CBS 781.70]|uniref:UDP-glucose:glycoprotein glucosyltransferase n=1 Tax=Eremomyces bilateralis CBS 781.70 TaxID=1392243 RepID=A0A6G1GDP7_9PEZI|nr:uncharacterized protein P152DRAFT_408965 [Eremomyces bilateralis CBS 781.70]KAF1816235.1 hypothetical protein P152DRAFT_408965 [Eremomyces bilateralis CBS 781.70]